MSVCWHSAVLPIASKPHHGRGCVYGWERRWGTWDVATMGDSSSCEVLGTGTTRLPFSSMCSRSCFTFAGQFSPCNICLGKADLPDSTTDSSRREKRNRCVQDVKAKRSAPGMTFSLVCSLPQLDRVRQVEELVGQKRLLREWMSSSRSSSSTASTLPLQIRWPDLSKRAACIRRTCI